MKKVKGIIILKKVKIGWDLIIDNLGQIKRECLDQWLKSENTEEIELEMEIKSVFQFKTTSQLGYLHAEIYRQWINYCRQQGVEDREEKIIEDLKIVCNFTEENINIFTNKKTITSKSLAKSSKEEVIEFIDKLIREGQELGIIFETPEEYKKRKNIKKWTN